MKSNQDIFFDAVSKRKMVRTSVRAIIIRDNRLLVQIPSDDVHGIYAFIGGEYEHGDSFDSRIRAELEEETNAKVVSWRYLFVVENKFLWNNSLIHGLEHYLFVEIDRQDVKSSEPELLQKWIPLNELPNYDVRPRVVKDIILAGKLFETKHAVSEL